ncbi:MAG: OB-fold nucleic acid binding domain-containing protein [Anaerolineae bacterium]|jgi:DNA/RNA endonuclease YhcR with UshA esterase domain
MEGLRGYLRKHRDSVTLAGQLVTAAAVGCLIGAFAVARVVPPHPEDANAPTVVLEVSGTPSPTEKPTDTAEPTRTPEPSATPTPQATATPLSTEEPADTLEPTVTAEATAPPQPELTSIGSVTDDRIGEHVTVEGTVIEADSFSEGFKFTLDDGEGQIVLLMWHEVYDGCQDRSHINLGAVVRAHGEITQYEGQLQIEPDVGDALKATQAAVPQALRRQIASISGADEGQRVMIEGEVVRTEGLPHAVNVFLGDGEPTGQSEVMIFIWRNVLDRIADNTGLGTPGSRVRVIGRVQIYRGNLEIVPALPHDVTVVDIP